MAHRHGLLHRHGRHARGHEELKKKKEEKKEEEEEEGKERKKVERDCEYDCSEVPDVQQTCSATQCLCWRRGGGDKRKRERERERARASR